MVTDIQRHTDIIIYIQTDIDRYTQIYVLAVPFGSLGVSLVGPWGSLWGRLGSPGVPWGFLGVPEEYLGALWGCLGDPLETSGVLLGFHGTFWCAKWQNSR